MNFLKQAYKYLLITIGGLIFLFSLFMTLKMDFITKSGNGVFTDGFNNEQNPENGKTYWTKIYIGERIVQVLGFYGGMTLIGHGFEIRKKENEAK